MKLINDIIDELSSEKGGLTNAFVKAKIVAHKLKNKELKAWINSELNGYPTDDIPKYRIYTCQVVGQVSNGYQRAKNFPIPLLHLDEGIQESLQVVKLTQSIATLDKYAYSEEGGKMIMPIQPELCSYMSEGLDNGWVIEYARREIDKMHVIHCLTEIRTKLLDFMLDLSDEIESSDGGEDLNSVNPELQEKVKNLFNSSVFGDNTTIIVGSQNTQNVTNTSIHGDFEGLEKVLKSKNVAQPDIDELKLIIDNDNVNHENKTYGDNVKAWVSKMIMKAMNLSWNVSVGAAGSLLGESLNAYYGWV